MIATSASEAGRLHGSLRELTKAAGKRLGGSWTGTWEGRPGGWRSVAAYLRMAAPRLMIFFPYFFFRESTVFDARSQDCVSPSSMG